MFAIIFGKTKDSLHIRKDSDWFMSVITGLIESLWLRLITWKTETPSQKSKKRFNREKARFNWDEHNFNGINQDLSKILS